MHEVMYQFTLMPLDGGYNPLSGVKPSLGPFQKALGPKISMLLGVVWALCMIVAVGFLLMGIVNFAKARTQHHATAAAEGAFDIGVPAVALVLLSAAAIFVGALV